MKTLLFIVQLIPALIELIKAIEAAIPASGQGREKLEAIRKIIEATYDGAKEMWPMIEKTIEAIVGLFNKTGIFTTSPK
jgi:hypothetical protein